MKAYKNYFPAAIAPHRSGLKRLTTWESYKFVFLLLRNPKNWKPHHLRFGFFVLTIPIRNFIVNLKGQ